MSSTKSAQPKVKRAKSSSPAKVEVAKKKPAAKKEPVVEKPVAVPVEEVETSESEQEVEEVEEVVAVPEKAKAKAKVAPKKKKAERAKVPRRVVTMDSIKEEFLKLEKVLLDEIAKHKESGTKGIKFLRTIGKQVRGVHLDTMRTLKKLSKKKRKKGDPSERKTVSGFCKLCKITPELASFIGCAPDEMKSRVDATRAIVSYVKNHGLQDVNAKKHINPDTKLAKLLKLSGNEKNDKGEKMHLTYPLVQRYIQPHFLKE